MLNAKNFALASAITMAILYAVCSAFVAIAPEIALQFGGWLIHITNVEQFAIVGMTFGEVLFGFLPILIYGYAGAYLFAWTYNKFSAPKA